MTGNQSVVVLDNDSSNDNHAMQTAQIQTTIRNGKSTPIDDDESGLEDLADLFPKHPPKNLPREPILINTPSKGSSAEHQQSPDTSIYILSPDTPHDLTVPSTANPRKPSRLVNLQSQPSSSIGDTDDGECLESDSGTLFQPGSTGGPPGDSRESFVELLSPDSPRVSQTTQINIPKKRPEPHPLDTNTESEEDLDDLGDLFSADILPARIAEGASLPPKSIPRPTSKSATRSSSLPHQHDQEQPRAIKRAKNATRLRTDRTETLKELVMVVNSTFNDTHNSLKERISSDLGQYGCTIKIGDTSEERGGTSLASSSVVRWLHDDAFEPDILLYFDGEQVASESIDQLITEKVKNLDSKLIMINNLRKGVENARKKGREPPGKKQLVQMLLKISVVHNCQIMYAENDDEVIELLCNLTMDISIRPYKTIQQSFQEHLGVDVGNRAIKNKSSDPSQTWQGMLSSLFRISSPMAESIRARYPTFRSLFEAYDACPTESAKENLLAGLPMGRKLDGNPSSKFFGSGFSKRIYIQLCSENPHRSLDNVWKD